MTALQEDKLSMYYVAKGVCEKYQSTWVANAVFAASYNLWVGKLSQIELNRDAQTIETTGVATDKSQKRLSLTDKVLFIANRLQSYANVTSNSDLLESVQYTASYLKKSRDTDLVGIGNTVLGKANANVTALAAYGVTAALMTDLQNAITAYAVALAKPKTAVAQTKTATENLLRLFKEADELMTKRMDLDIEMFKVSKPDFYSQYKTARIIVATGRGKSALIANVAAVSSGEPIKGVLFTFNMDTKSVKNSTTMETAKSIVKKSTSKGNFRIGSMSEGIYNVIVKKIGYKEQVLNIVIANGETTSLNVALEMV